MWYGFLRNDFPYTSCFCLSTLAAMKLLYFALLLVCVVSIGALEHMPAGPEETPRAARVARTASTDRPIHIPPPNPRIPRPVYPEDPVDLSLNGLKNLEPDELIPRPVYPEDALDPLPNELEEDMEPNEFDKYDFDDPDLWVDDDEGLVDDDVELLDDDEELQDNARPIWPEDPDVSNMQPAGPEKPTGP